MAAPAPADSKVTATASPAYGAAITLGTVTDPTIAESSGLGASRRNPGLHWTHNDSGDDPLVYCLDAQARACGVWLVGGAEAFDWEDMAVGPGPIAGESYLYIGDIGDNIRQRTEIVVFRVPEPRVDGGAAVTTKDAPATTPRADVLRLRYPDGPHDAEALLVHPATGDVYVIAKDGQAAGVYKAARAR